MLSIGLTIPEKRLKFFPSKMLLLTFYLNFTVFGKIETLCAKEFLKSTVFVKDIALA